MIISQSFGNLYLKKNLGNQLFELASLFGMARRYETRLILPNEWLYRSCFKSESFVEFKNVESYITIQEPDFQCCLSFFDRIKQLIKDENVNMHGFWQSEQYWKPFETEIRELLTFAEPIRESAHNFLKDNSIDINSFLAVSVRRGDFVTDSGHYLLPIEYYMGAIEKYYQDKDIMIFSDDIPWCKDNFKISGRRIIFSEDKNAIEQLSIMSLFKDFVIANSTFSWWGAYLSNANNKKVVRPYCHFDGELRKKWSIKDHYPQSWIVHNHFNVTMCHPTYIINFPERFDRREHIIQEFADKTEFDIEILEPLPHTNNTMGLWLTLHSIISKEKEKNSSYFIFCEDNHTFTNSYSPNLLEKDIILADKLQADILLGGVSWFDSGIKTDENLFWIHRFIGMQFTVIFNRFYDKLLEVEYDDNVVTDLKISGMTDKKWMVYPHISIQTEFVYSDIANSNMNFGIIENLSKSAIDYSEAISKVSQCFNSLHSQESNDMSDEIPVDITIPTYVINLKERPERLFHVLSQFEGKTEFDIRVVEACRHRIGAVGLWQSIVKIIREVVNEDDDDMIIICEDDHTFTPDYCRDEFIRHIIKAYEQGCELLSGGIGGFGNAFPADENRYWIDWFWCTQFIVIYRPLFGKILDVSFTDKDTADGKLSEMVHNKMTIYPFISIQHDFGYSDVTLNNNDIKGKITEHFRDADERLGIISKMLRYHEEITTNKYN